MSILTSTTRCRPLGLLRGLTLLLFVLVPATAATAEPRWMLIYYRQIGNIENAGSRTIENHLFYENGTKAAGIGVTNFYNMGRDYPIFAYSDSDGWNRLNPLDPNNCVYDIRIYNATTDQSPDFYFQNPATPRYYSYVTHWMYVSNPDYVTPYPTMPVYHYDLVDGLNQVSGMNWDTCTAAAFTEPPGVWSDAKTLTEWTTYQAQTFVVPPGINRIVSAQAFMVRESGNFTYKASIHSGSPTGTRIGPFATSPHHASQFKEAAVCWGINDVPVTAGQTYALRLEATDGGGFNAYATTANNYPQGCLYNGAAQKEYQDLFAVVVGVGYDTTPPHINRSPALLTRSVVRRNNLPNDTFTIANGGGGTLTYTITDNASWLSVNPTAGSSTGETDTISVLYNTAGLAIGSYSGTITINATGADNTPQTVVVNLSVTAPPFAPCDFDTDQDVDQEDFGVFQSCYTGPGVDQTNPACAGAMLDLDTDVDYEDFARFLACMGGPDIPVDTTCAD